MFERKIKLFKLMGFEVGIDPSWIILAVLVAWSLSTGYFPFEVQGLSVRTYWIMGFIGAAGFLLDASLPFALSDPAGQDHQPGLLQLGVAARANSYGRRKRGGMAKVLRLCPGEVRIDVESECPPAGRTPAEMKRSSWVNPPLLCLGVACARGAVFAHDCRSGAEVQYGRVRTCRRQRGEKPIPLPTGTTIQTVRCGPGPAVLDRHSG